MDKYQEILKKYNYSPDQLSVAGEKKSQSGADRIAELQGLGQETEQKGFLADAKEDIKGIKEGVTERLGERADAFGEQETLAGKLAQGLGFASDVAGEAVFGLGKAALPQGVEDAVSEEFQSGVTKAVEATPDAVKDGVSKLNALKEKNPALSETIDLVANAALVGLDVAGAGVAAKGVKKGVVGLKKGAESAKDLAKTTTKRISEAKVAKKESKILENITPKTSELKPTEYSRLLSKGRIEPKTATSPARYILSDSEKATALKHQDLLNSNDPVKNTINIFEEISRTDADVMQHLTKNNSIFNKGELRNNLFEKLEDISDLTVDETRLLKEKQKLVDNFVNGLEKNDMLSLWRARKQFDQRIEKAFSGSRSLQKDMKVSFRNAVQDFISERTDDVTYKSLMREMSDLFNVSDLVEIKAAKEKSLTGITKWIKDNPVKAKVVGYGVPSVVGANVLFGD